jgi:hypothetical protein
MVQQFTAMGSLRVHPENPRYFDDGSGRPVYLTGAHTWSNLQDQLSPDPDVKFDCDAYINWMSERHYNFMHGWAWEQAAWDNHTTAKLLGSQRPTGARGRAIHTLDLPDVTAIQEAYVRQVVDTVNGWVVCSRSAALLRAIISWLST